MKFVYDGYKLIEELDGTNSNALLRSYVWQPEGVALDVPLTLTIGTDVYYYLTDANKNVTELIDSQGTVVAHYEYSPFGKTVVSSGALALVNPFRFSSEYFDSETELVYYNYRYYSPELGRWLSRDPIEEQGGLNLYGMLDNDAVNFSDFYGLAPVVDPSTDVSNPNYKGNTTDAFKNTHGDNITRGSAEAKDIALTQAIDAINDAILTTLTGPAGKGLGATLKGLKGAARKAAAKARAAKRQANKLSQKLWEKAKEYAKKLKGKKDPCPTGKAFDPNGPKTQVGVDPNSLTPSKDLNSLGRQRLNSAEEYGRDQAISVDRNGVIQDGHHRTRNAIDQGRSVDVTVDNY